MPILKWGLGAAIILAAVLGLLSVTGVVAPDQLADLARMAFLGLLVLIAAGAALRLLRPTDADDSTGPPAP